MKKLVFAASILMLSFGAKAQSPGQFKIGANIGLPVGDVADVSSFTAGVDAAYLWNVGEKFQVGPTVGFQNYFLKSDYKDAGFTDFNYIPLAASGQYSIVPEFFIGADLGYALTTSGGEDAGGFYYMPKIGYQQQKWELFGGYRAVNNDVNFGAINLGFNFKF
ncbi:MULTISPECIES: porin family protein [unclassified Sphingobacterium]|uniref:porin family protein n=2 Tax=Sphingobacterium TaxID=28453 RepID=UPI0020C4DE8E|nr:MULTISPECIES: porin family protein [unclassified Sphingobacterium]